jgi:hypothetical protein
VIAIVWEFVAAAFHAMQKSQQEYSVPDRRCGRLTVSERELGVFDVI